MLARDKVRTRQTAAPLPTPAWFPVYDPTSLASGLMAIAATVLHDCIGREREGLPIPKDVYATLARLLLRYLGWCLPRHELPANAATELADRMQAKRVCTAEKAARDTMLFSVDWLTRGMEADARQRELTEARENARKLFGERLRKRSERALNAKRSRAVADTMEVVRALRERLGKGGGFFVVQELVHTAVFAIAENAGPDEIGAMFATHLAPGLALGDHARRAKLDRARATLAKTIAKAMRPNVPNDPVALAERACAGLSVPLRELCGEHFNSWADVAVGRQGGRTT
jgi:hypothetical protein